MASLKKLNRSCILLSYGNTLSLGDRDPELNRRRFGFQAIPIWLAMKRLFGLQHQNCIVDHEFDPLLNSFQLNSTIFNLFSIKYDHF